MIPPQKRSVEAFIFDMDGLMVDTEPIARRSWEIVLGHYGHQITDSLYGSIVGMRPDDSALLFQKMFELPISAAQLAAQERDAFTADVERNGIPPMPGLYGLISELGRRDIPWAVATSSRQQYARSVLDLLGLTGSCKALVTGDEVQNGKPAPDIYLLAAKRLGIVPGKCLVLEDSVHGCQAAAAAGMIPLAVPNTHTNGGNFDCARSIYPSLRHVQDELDALLGPP